jgi:hypothetical protein
MPSFVAKLTVFYPIFAWIFLASCGAQRNPYDGRKPNLPAPQEDRFPDAPDSPGIPDTNHDDSRNGGRELDYDWRAEGVLSVVTVQNFTGENYGSEFYQDILSHTKPDFYQEPATTAHETMHGLHSEMRGRTKDIDAFVFHRDGTGMYVKEPKENLRDVRNHIGASFRKLAKYNYDLYLIKQVESWPNTLYIFDEWASYIGTARTAIEAQAAGKWTPVFASNNFDPIEGMAEFMYFCSATILSIKNIDPDYLNTNKQYKAAFAMTMEESVHWLNQARITPFWQRTEAYDKFANLQTAADAEPVRAAVRELMGETWTKRVMGF